MKQNIFNEHGFAVVYGLVILLLVTVGGTALLFMAQKDRVNAGDYSKTRSTTQAANAALKACEGQFLKNPDIALAILKKYKLDATYKYILNASDAAANVKTKYQMEGAGSPEYIAEIKGFDQDQQIVLIEGTGFGDNGGKKKALASYQLEGLKMVTPPPAVSGGKYALYLLRDGDNFNYGITVNGNAYFGGQFRTQGSGMVRINGNVKTANVNTAPNAILNQVVISGNAYFRCPMSFQNATTEIQGLAGFEKALTLSANVICRDNVYSNAGASGAGKITMQSGKTLLHSGSFPSASMSGGTLTSNSGTITDIDARLGMCTGDEGAVTFDTTKIPAANKKSYSTVFGSTSATLTAAPVNAYYANNPSALWNGYLVIRIGASDWPGWSANPGSITCKVIWIIQSGKCLNPPNTCFWPNNSAAGSVQLIYIPTNTQMVPFQWSGTMRGVVYVTGTSTDNTQTQFYCANQTLIGSVIVNTASNLAWELNAAAAGNTLTITYDDAIIQGFCDIGPGFATRPTLTCGGGGGGGGGGAVLTLVDKKIRPKLLTKQL